jgi:lipopolysaccharide biosynthesis glycosyltransferase
LHSADSLVEREMLTRVEQYYKNCRITYINITGFFQDGYEVRGITKATYYRLLIPRLIPQYSKVIYADVDMIFRMDLSELYDTNIDNVYIAATYDMGMLLTEAGKKHVCTLGVECDKYIQAGLLLLNSQKIREENLECQFMSLYKNNYKFQDQDILNVTCAKKHLRLPMKYNMTDYSFILLREDNDFLKNISASEINEALETGNLHYNGHKPWKKFSLNFDIWWEYYRKSPIFDMEYYIDFYYDRLNLFDQLSLWKRIKILLRYFVYGKRKI